MRVSTRVVWGWLLVISVLSCDNGGPRVSSQEASENKAPISLEAQVRAADALFQRGQFQEAAAQFGAIAEAQHGTAVSADAWYYAGESFRGAGRLEDAAGCYYRALEVLGGSGNQSIHQRLAFVLSTTGQNWLATPHFGFLVSSGTAAVPELALFGDLNRPVDQRPFLDECAKTAPEDAFVRLGLALHDFWEGHSDKARTALSDLLSKRPDLLAGQAALGQLLVDGDAEQFARWHTALPADAERNPDIWLVRALFARRVGNADAAERCLSEALVRNPQHRRALYQLAQLYEQANDSRAKEFGDRAEDLILLTQEIDAVLDSQGRNPEAIRRVSLRLESIGRIWEACAWGVQGRAAGGDQEWIAELFTRRQSQIAAKVPLQLPERNLALKVDLASLAPFKPELLESEVSRPSSVVAKSQIRFELADVGLDFVYENGAEKETEGPRMFEQTGGGVAVTDFDRDHRPDLYFTQGQKWKHGSLVSVNDTRLHDALYRNRGVEYLDVSTQSLPAEASFGQGATVGDFDSDGFDDIYVGNLGKNTLLLNQGDGTFIEQPLEDGDVAWTASVVMVDLNDDGLPDLFDANYLEGEGIFIAICNGRACSPSGFQGAANRLRVNTGDGQVREVEYEQDAAASKSLGVLILPEAEHPRRPSMFVANDQTANGFLANEETGAGDNIRLVDDSLMRGLAYNDNGLAMACMGIAADDIDRSGTTDLFVTNFSNESNTLYLRDSLGAFVDATGPSGLDAASFAYVGWGTQALDADLDGWPDLVLVNGNVDDDVDEGEESEMRPQFFRNIGQARFRELMAEDAGEFFGQKYLGRGLARLDWNDDGRMDFAVSNIRANATLLTNETTGQGSHLSFMLHAVNSARDAIGTRIVVEVGDSTIERTLLAGDGFMASNQRIVQFGLGDAGGPLRATVVWPSGEVQQLSNLSANSTLEISEGASAATVWLDGLPRAFAVAE